MTKKSPQLRFEGFTDDWEERKLGEVVEGEIKGKAKANMQGNRSIYLETEYLNGGETTFVDSDADVEEDDILILWDGSQAGTVYHGFFGALGSTLKAYRPKESGKFVYYQLVAHQEMIFQRYRTPNIPHVIKTFTEEFSVFTTSLPEQERIGNFFKQLDNIIALHQRKLDLLKEQKKGFLQKMFPKNGEKVPELRFAGFADDWEDRKLSSIAERVTRKNKNNESTLPLTISAQDGLVDQNDYFNKQVASRDVTGYFLVKNGEFAYNKSYSNGYPWGAIKRLDKYEMGVLSTLYIVFKPTAINSQFLVSYYETTRWYREVSKNAAEGARNHGLLNISPNDFFNTLLTIPKSAEEQQQIGSFFKQLDDTIALHQRKLDLLKEQKKGFLQKMFV